MTDLARNRNKTLYMYRFRSLGLLSGALRCSLLVLPPAGGMLASGTKYAIPSTFTPNNITVDIPPTHPELLVLLCILPPVNSQEQWLQNKQLSLRSSNQRRRERLVGTAFPLNQDQS